MKACPMRDEGGALWPMMLIESKDEDIPLNVVPVCLGEVCAVYDPKRKCCGLRNK